MRIDKNGTHGYRIRPPRPCAGWWKCTKTRYDAIGAFSSDPNGLGQSPCHGVEELLVLFGPTFDIARTAW